MHKPEIEHERPNGIHITRIAWSEGTEYWLTATPQPDETPAAFFARIAALLNDWTAAPIAIQVFGAASVKPVCEAVFASFISAITWIEEESATVAHLRGMEVWAASEHLVSPLRLGGSVAGAEVCLGGARFCRIGSLIPAETTAPPAAQASEVFRRMSEIFAASGFDFSNLLRTWFFNRDILAWYDEFNHVRDAFFREVGLYDAGGQIPASTGIGGKSPGGPALVAAALAAEIQGEITVSVVPSPLQNSARDYGSAFSRAVELETPGLRRLFISGTASIDRDGLTIHQGDLDAQLRHTLDVVHALLQSRGMDWSDTSRAILYYRREADRETLEAGIQRAGLDGLPLLLVHNTVCREDLLCELELDALKAS